VAAKLGAISDVANSTTALTGGTSQAKGWSHPIRNCPASWRNHDDDLTE
jgi:hypothetical protein